MAKWADYCISQVRYNSEHTHIIKVIALPDNGEKLGTAEEWSRTQVISALEKGYSFITVTLSNGNWNRGAEVRPIVVNGTKYIRTDANQKAADNLGNLPEF